MNSIKRTTRRAAIRRRTRGTEVEVEFRLDGAGRSEVSSPFESLNVLLEMMAGHGGMDLRVTQRVNQHADEGYSIDDLADTLAEALRRSLGARPKIRQFGSETLPVGDALVTVAVDLVSPPILQLDVAFRGRQIDDLSVELLRRFLARLVDRLGAGVHIRAISGEHDLNKTRAIFLALGRAIAIASEPVDREGAREVAADIDYDDDYDADQRPPSSGGEFEDLGAPDDERESAPPVRGRPRRSRERPSREGASREGAVRESASREAARPAPAPPAFEFEEESPEVGAAVATVARHDNDDNDRDDDDENSRSRRRRGRRGGRGRRRSGDDPGQPNRGAASDRDGDSGRGGDPGRGADSSRDMDSGVSDRVDDRVDERPEAEVESLDFAPVGASSEAEERPRRGRRRGRAPEPVGASVGGDDDGEERATAPKRANGARGARDDGPLDDDVLEPPPRRAAAPKPAKAEAVSSGREVLDFVTSPPEAPAAPKSPARKAARTLGRRTPRGGRRRR